MNSIDFLCRVWDRQCSDGDKVFLSTKRGEDWKDHKFLYNVQLKKRLESFFNKYSPSRYDVYFCPLSFSTSTRSKKGVKNTSMLWSDIDEVDRIKIKPSVLWESSPGRYQGLWFLDEESNPLDAQDLNKKLTYYIGADKGGWDLTQVLRIPDTLNHKYKSLPKVKMLHYKGRVEYNYDKLLNKVSKPKEEDTPSLSSDDIIAKYRKEIPRKLLSTLMAKSVTKGKRSDIIWYLENKLKEIGLSPEEIICVIKDSKWNKYAGRADEDERLRTEIEKIIESNIEDDTKVEIVSKNKEPDNSVELILESFQDLMGSITSKPGWLVDGFWLGKSNGIVAGEPKSFKSTLVLDLAVSVASGKPFLDKFEVHDPGPVLIIQNENSDWIMKDRIEKICSSKGLVGEVSSRGRKYKIKFAEELPIHFINQQGYMVNDPIHQKILEDLVDEIKPSLIILDPLYLMFDGDINSAQELNPTLNWLLSIKQQYDTALLVVHHWNKGGSTHRGGQRMLGSTTLHGWIESAWYVGSDGDETDKDEPQEDSDEINKPIENIPVIIEREFRGAGVHPKVSLSVNMGNFGSDYYHIDVERHKPRSKTPGKKIDRDDVMNEIISYLKNVTSGDSIKNMSEGLKYSRQVIYEEVDNLIIKDLVYKDGRKIKLIGGK